MPNKDITIIKLVVHILDSSIGIPVISDNEHPTDSTIYDYIAKHLSKILNDPNLKQANFNTERSSVAEMCIALKNNHKAFYEVSTKISSVLYTIQSENPDIPSSDVVCCLFDLNGSIHLGIVKLNYKPSYIHYINASDNGNTNSIIIQKTSLPNTNQKIEECCLINLEDLSILLIEKKYVINNKSQFYLSTLFLGCTSDISGKEKIKILQRSAEEFVDKYYGETNIEKRLHFKRVVNENIEDRMSVDVEEIADTIFGSIPEVKEKYISDIVKKGIHEAIIPINYEKDQGLYKKQKIVTDTGIEINLRLGEFSNKDKIEFMNNPDGTISIILKNIKKIN